MNKKTKMVLLTNIILFIVLLLCAEFSFYKLYCKGVEPLLINHQRITNQKLKIKYSYPVLFNIDDYKNGFREIKGSKPSQPPILLVGASYTSGHNLEKNQRLDYKLSKLTGRTVYTKAIDGTGPQSLYYLFKNTDIKKEIPDIGFIIYPFVPSHIYKPYEYSLSYLSTRLNIRYKDKNGKLEEIKPLFPILYSSFTVKMAQNYLRDAETSALIKEGKQYNLFNTIMDNTIQTTRKDFPNSKFIILEYPDPDFGILESHKITKIPQKEREYLEKLGFIYINANELTGKNIGTPEYRSDDKDHPNEKAWNEIVPRLVKKLNL